MSVILPDAEARRRALTDLGTTLLVEAGAGTGKTSLLAARVTMLLLEGADPSAIAAISFTEAAASELAERVHRYVSALLTGKPPEPLKDLLAGGLDAEQVDRLRHAANHLDGLTTTTIHGFCQILIANFAVEANIDPGAEVIDEDGAMALFERVFDAWLTRHLSADAAADDPIVILTREDPRGVVALLRDIALHRREHRSAAAPRLDPQSRPDLELIDAVDSLKRWCQTVPAEPSVAKVMEELETLAAQFAGCFAQPPGFERLWQMAHPEPSPRMIKNRLALYKPKTLNLWKKAAGAEAAPGLVQQFEARFDRIDAAYRQMLAVVAAEITARLSGELNEVLADYAAAKRAAAVFDFDDLLEQAATLLRAHPAVRAACADRFRFLLVDEFQDTDPLQCDIVFRLGASDHAEEWQELQLRPGALFFVGDPKQSLFLFRGAAIRSYAAAKAVIERSFPGNVLPVTSNFRTIEPIIAYVNRCFAAPLSEPGQPGYVALAATRRTPRHALPAAARLTVELPPAPNIREVRDAEAAAVARLCARLVGGLDLVDDNGSRRKAGAGDIALLAPAGTDLWRYEAALQAAGLPFASRAGRGFYRRQEIQDMVALARLLADPGDTLALGAFLRGPMVGITDEQLLDATWALPHEPGAPRPTLSLHTPLEQVDDLGLREILAILQALRRRARHTTPSQLLAEAVERLAIRVVLSRRDPRRASAANANIDLFLQRAAAYHIRGLRRFAQDIGAAWFEGESQAEGRVDAEGEAIDIVSIHSAKGLEWPIVIVINSASGPRPRRRIVHRVDDDSLHWTIDGLASPGLEVALAAEAHELACERARLLYVGCTRAKDLLVLPRLPIQNPAAYARAVDLAFDTLPELDVSAMAGAPPRPDRGPPNEQDQAAFAAESAAIAAMSRPIAWLRPSAHDDDRIESDDLDDEQDDHAPESLSEIVGAGRLRGLLLHKLIEEILWEGLEETREVLAERAHVLMSDLASPAATQPLPDADEVAKAALAALALPDIAALRPYLVPEVPLYAMIEGDDGAAPMAGRADALVVEADTITAVVDWKSDVAPGDRQRHEHVEQIRLYMTAVGAARGALVYASLGWVRWVDLPADWSPESAAP